VTSYPNERYEHDRQHGQASLGSQNRGISEGICRDVIRNPIGEGDDD